MGRGRRHVSTLVLLACAALSVGWADERADPVAIQREIRHLETEFFELQAAGKIDDAFAVLDRMASIDPDHPYVFALIVSEYRNSQRFDEAEERMLARGRPGPGLEYGLGHVDFFRTEYEKAEKRYREALEQYRARGHLAGQAAAHVFLGNTLWSRHKSSGYEDCVREYRKARDLFEQLEDPGGVAQALSRLATVQQATRRYDEAERSARDAVGYAEQSGDFTALGRAWKKVGEVLVADGREAEAVKEYERALEVQRRWNDRPGELATLMHLSGIYTKRDRDPHAESVLLEAVRLARVLGDRDSEVRARTKLAGHYETVGREREAIAQLRRVLEDPSAFRSRYKEPRARYQLGELLFDLGELAAAGHELELAAASASRVEFTSVEADVRTRLATILISNGSFARALVQQLRALELYRSRKSGTADEISALNNVGLIYYEMGVFDSAERYLGEGLKLAVELDDRARESLLRQNLALTLSEQGRLDESLDQQLRAIAPLEEIDDPRMLAFGRTNAAATLWRLGRKERASELLQAALTSFRDPAYRSAAGEGLVLNLLGDFAKQEGELDRALSHYRDARDIARDHGASVQLGRALYSRAELYRRTSRPDQALTEYREALEVHERMRSRTGTGEFKMRYISGSAELYERAISAQVDLENSPAPETFRLVEQAGARSLSDSLAESHADVDLSLPPDLAQKQRAMIDLVGTSYRDFVAAGDAETREAARRKLGEADERLQAFELTLRQAAPQYADVVYSDPITLRDVQRLLRDDETLLRYYVGEFIALLWVVDRKGARVSRLASPDELARRVERFSSAARRPDARAESVTAAAADLAAELLPSGIAPGRRLVVVPDGPLHYVPFEALRRDGRSLIEDHEIVSVPSVTVLDLLRDTPGSTAPAGFLGVGDPIPSSEDTRFGPLPFSRQALGRIAGLFPDERTAVVTGKQANRQRVLNELERDYRLVHFATHGWLDDDTPKYYGLRLSSTAGDGSGDFLTLNDIFGLRLTSDLVVLSACRSGLGEQLRGEGLVGLTRAFLYAGARSLVVSLWNVNDRSTAELMEAFYRELATGRSIPAALRHAKLGFIRSEVPALRRPYRWAPFVLIGDPGPVGVGLNPSAELRTNPVLSEPESP
ncbi:MAG: CHAT domain-containing protein [bacterium]|nr:CHAT domain-containing protein [bacterium]